MVSVAIIEQATLVKEIAMWFRTLFDNLLARSSRTRSRKSRLAPSFGRRSRSFRPLLDVLEHRTLLSTYVVDSLTDTGTGSGLAGDLRYCVTNATSGNDTITFAPSLTGTINLESALPALNASVAIQGPGVAALIVWRDPFSSTSFPVFAVGSSATVEISGLSIINTNQTYESAIANSGTLTVSACYLNGNSESAIANSGTLTVSACNLHTYNGNGSCITNSGTTTIEGSDFSGGLFLGYGAGAPGAIDNTGTMTISNSAFEGFYLPGTVPVIANHGVLTINYSTLSDNYVGCGPGEGGAIFNQGALTINNSTLNNNHVAGGDDAQGGGAIFNQGALTINNSTLNNNHVAGGISKIGTTVIGHNGRGGGIYMSAGTLSINSSTLVGNEADGGGGGYPTEYSTGSTGGQGGNGQGGGLYIAGGMVSINSSTFDGNNAIPGFVYRGSPGAGFGGGIYNAAGPSALQMYDTILAYNSAITAAPDLDGSVTSLGHNLIADTSGGSGFDPTDLLNVDPLLGGLQDNGGPTQTIALLPGSPALNAGDPNEIGNTDQRGVIRTGGVNIGAYQASATAFLVNAPDTVQSGVPFDVTLTALDPFNQVAVGYTGTVTFQTSDPDPGVVLPADYTFTLGDGGSHTFTDTGLGETTLVTPGDQTLTVMDTSDNTIIGSATITVSAGLGPEPHGQGRPPGAFPASPAQSQALPQSEPSANEGVVRERWFISLHDGDAAWLTMAMVKHQARGQTDSGLADLLGGEDLLLA
jgi:hypothetical protein